MGMAWQRLAENEGWRYVWALFGRCQRRRGGCVGASELQGAAALWVAGCMYDQESSVTPTYLDDLEEADIRVPGGGLTVRRYYLHIKQPVGQAKHALQHLQRRQQKRGQACMSMREGM